MDRAEIGTAARRYIGELGNTYVEDDVLTDAINASQSRLNTDTQYYKVDVTMSINGGGREFAIPTTANDLFRVRLGTGTDRVSLDPMSPAGLRRADSGWEGGTAGTPTEYYTEGGYIGFDPKPRNVSAWVSETAYSAGDRIVPSATDNGFIYTCATAGTSGTTSEEPTWPTTIDGTVSEDDYDTVWKQSGSTRIWLRTLKEPHTLSGGGSAPEWLPQRFHRTIAKGAALDILGGFDSENQASDKRTHRQLTNYLSDVRRLKTLGGDRSREYTPRVTMRFK